MAENEKKNAGKDIKDNVSAGGYTFDTSEQADKAREELEAIKYLSSKIDYKDADQVYRLYNNIINEGFFKTQVGLDYLKKLQQYLYKSKSIPNEKIRPIPISADIKEAMDDRRETSRLKALIKELTAESQRYKSLLVKSVIINIALIIVVIAMLVITLRASNPNIINYESALQDKYSSWEEDLKAREKKIGQREAQLGIQ